MELDYFNTRIRGLRSALLSPADYDSLLNTVRSALMDRLRSTPYGPYIEAAGAEGEKGEEEVFESALRASLADALSKVWQNAPEDARPLLKAFFSIWEVQDLKAVVRGITRGVEREEILKTVIPAGEFDSGAIKTLLDARDLNDLARFLSSWHSPYAAPLKAGLPEYMRDGSTREIELNVDTHINSVLSTELKGGGADRAILRGVFSLKIDMLNVLTLMTAVGEGYSEEGVADFFIEGGQRLKKRDFVSLSGLKDRAELIKSLLKLSIDPAIKDVLSGADPQDAAMIEEKFDDALEVRLKREALKGPLTIALGAGFIYEKVRETKNLRIIFRGKSFGMPEAEIKTLIIYPR